MTTLLAIETSTPDASITLWSGGNSLYEAEFVSDRGHNSMIFEPLAEALAALDGRELTAVLVGTGPGSYSGTRIGIAAAQGVAIAHNCPSAGLGSLAATPIARRAVVSTEKPEAMAIGDARRGLYYASTITESGEAAEPQLMDAQALNELVASHSTHAVFTLDDPAKLPLNEALAPRLTCTHPHSRALIELWLELDEDRRRELCKKPLAPTYLRAPFTSKAKQGHPLLRKG